MTKRTLFGILGVLSCCACVDEEESLSGDSFATTEQHIYGDVSYVEETHTDGVTSAIAALVSGQASAVNNREVITCSGTLVNPMKVVTAAHCLRPDLHHVYFPQNGGFESNIVEVIPGPGVTIPYGGAPSGEDIAVLTLETPVPRWIATPVPIGLDDMQDAFVDHYLQTSLIGGFGGTVHYDSYQGLGYRRVGTSIWTVFDGGEWHVGNLIPYGSSVTAEGDSGGGLFDGSYDAGHTLVGVLSGWYRYYNPISGSDYGYSVYSPTFKGSALRTFFLEALAWAPPVALPSFALTDVAVYGSTAVWINDRSAVLMPDKVTPARVASGGFRGISFDGADMELGADAKVGDLWVNDNVHLRDRARAGNIVAEGRVIRGNNTITGSVLEHHASGMPLITLPTWPSGTPGAAVVLQPDSGVRELDTGSVVRLIGNVIVNRGATLSLRPSSVPYYFESLTIEPGGAVTLDTTGGPQRIFLKSGFIYRGSINDSNTTVVGDILIGVHGTGSVSLEAPLVATVVAPERALSLDANSRPFTGSFFARTVTVHQATVVYHRPFTWSW